MTPIGLGIDLVEVGRIRSLLERHGQRFKERTFTEGEMAYCDHCADPAMHYAARFAAKEAAAKALGTGLWSQGVDWRQLEVVREPSGKPHLVLHGEAAEHAKRMGSQGCLLSITHTQVLAMAQVILV
ncbi:MAG: holo-ACP synthase [Prosthecobacter sp.]|jgi:holo-[acyl-carrier protein] synthase|nr:holo-ACP synthase [Prosthecobacter sp.]